MILSFTQKQSIGALRALMCFFFLALLQSAWTQAVSVTPSVTTPSCRYTKDGAVSLTVSGGSGKFTYKWTAADTLFSTNKDLTSLISSLYKLTVIDTVNKDTVRLDVAVPQAIDTLKPVVKCKDTKVYLDSMGKVKVNLDSIKLSVTDNCGIDSLWMKPDSFDCLKIDTNRVVLWARDTAGNIDSCMAKVVVRDTIKPKAICKDTILYLDAAGRGTVKAAQLNSQSWDNCKLFFALSKDTFYCHNKGVNSVNFIARDSTGNTDTCRLVVTVKDTIPPSVSCKDTTIYIDAGGKAALTVNHIKVTAADNCGIDTLFLDKYTFYCNNKGINNVLLTARDSSNNIKTCTAKVTVKDTVAPFAKCQDVIVYLNSSGNVNITASAINNGSSDNCGINTLSLSKTLFDCSNRGINNVILTVKDSSDNSQTCTAKVTVIDSIKPILKCKDVTIYVNSLGTVGLTLAQVNDNSTDNCGIENLILNKTQFTCSNIGVNEVGLIGIDASGNVNICTTKVTVSDNIPPFAKCKDATIYLNTTGTADLLLSQIDNGTTDNCKLESVILNKTQFNCTQRGINDVMLVARDSSGNIGSCNAKVTVLDTIKPIAKCSDLTVYLNAVGIADIAVTQLNNNSSDNCKLESLTISKSQFNCTNFGLNDVILTAKDSSSNTSACIAKVSVRDTTLPSALCKNLTVYLDDAGKVAITPAQVSNGSVDNCNTILTLSKSSFTCSNIGQNLIVLSVKDLANNESKCNATITVADTTKPKARCKDATIYIDGSGRATLTVVDIDNGTSDNCTVRSFNLSKTNFDCTNFGFNTITLTVRDSVGNLSTCNSTILVKDTIPPSVFCSPDIIKTLPPKECEMPVTYSVFFNDNCSGASIFRTEGLANGSIFPRGTTNMSFNVFDVSGNVAKCSFKVIVNDYPATGTMACISSQNVALGANCYSEVTKQQVLTGSNYRCLDDYSLRLLDGLRIIPGNIITSDLIGKTIIAQVIDPVTNNSCRGNVIVTDAVPPTIEPPSDAVLTCNKVTADGVPPTSITGTPRIVFECSNNTSSTFIDQVFSRTCTDPFTSAPQGFPSDLTFNTLFARNCSRIIVRTFTVRDGSSNAANTRQVIYIRNADFGQIICASSVQIRCDSGLPVNTEPDTLNINGKMVPGTGRPQYVTGERLNSGTCSITATWQDTRFDNFDGTYLIRREWTLYNPCTGTFFPCTQTINVDDGYPSVSCNSGLTIQMSSTKRVVVKAAQLISQATDKCTSFDNLKKGIRLVGQGTTFPTTDSLVFTCTDLKTHNVEIWIRDDQGYSAKCNSTVTITDDNLTGFCFVKPVSIEGNITNELNIPMRALVNLYQNNNQVPMSSQTGTDYKFKTLESGQNYMIRPERPSDWRTGVSTFDIVAINKHIIGLETLNSPYKIIAADVNNDGDVAASDMLFVRRLILRYIDSIPGNRPWRYIPKAYKFADPTNPFSSDFPESLNYANLKDSVLKADFIAIKIADANISARTDFRRDDTLALEVRDERKPLVLNIENTLLKAGETKEIVFSAEEKDIEGIQFTLSFNQNYIKILKLESIGLPKFTDGHYAIFNDKGKVTFGWNGTMPQGNLFKLTLTATQNVDLREVLTLNSDWTPAEAYTTIGQIKTVKLNINSPNTEGLLPEKSGGDFYLLQNNPNPFVEETRIRFHLPKASEVTITIFDEVGRVVKIIKNNFVKGDNDVLVQLDTPSVSVTFGVLFYRLDTPTHSATRRMVLIK